jgi:hypothetical protein
MFFTTRRNKSDDLLRKALRTRDLRDRDLLLAHARELNEIALEAQGDRRGRGVRAEAPVTLEVEAVARRMCLAFHLDWRGDAPTRWDALVDDQWPDFVIEAQAAVEALRAVAPDPRVRAWLQRAAQA